MAFDFAKFCVDYDIPVAPEEHEHSTVEWLNVSCPFCAGNPGYHLGFSTASSYFHCWRCGGHSAFEVMVGLLGCPAGKATSILSQYKARPVRRARSTRRTQAARNIEWPLGAKRLGPTHRAYLQHRDFEPQKLEEKWGLRGVGPVGPYKFRIIAPIHFQGFFVSYQGRDITDRSRMKYKPCYKEIESRPHKDCLYGLDHATGGSVVIVEGIADVWRLGYGAVGTFGIGYTQKQILLLSEYAKQYIIFDNEPQAQIRAQELAASLSALGGESFRLNLDVGDPAEMTQGAADKLMKNLIGRAA